MSKKNRLSLADLGLLVEDIEMSAPEPSETILTNAPEGSGTDEALSMIDGGDTSPGVNWKPEMQGSPDDAPEDREAETLKDAGKGISSGTQSGDASSNAAKQGAQADSNEKPDFLKKDSEEKTEESFKLTAEDLGLFFEDEEGEQDKGQQGGQQGGQQKGQQGGQQSGQQSGGQQKGQQGGQQKGQQGGQQAGSQSGHEVGGEEAVDECKGRLMDHNLAAGEIAVDQDLMKDILRAAVADQPDDSQIDLIVQAIAGCCGEDRTLTVADADAIMGKLKELAGGQQGGQQMGAQGGQQMGGQQGAQGGQQAPMGGQQGSPEQIDAVPPGDGEIAGPEGGSQHEGKTKLMAGLGESVKNKKSKKTTLAEAWLAAINPVGVPTVTETEEIDEDEADLRRMARAAGMPEWYNVGRK